MRIFSVSVHRERNPGAHPLRATIAFPSSKRVLQADSDLAKRNIVMNINIAEDAIFLYFGILLMFEPHVTVHS
jgi:hypothetical protein